MAFDSNEPTTNARQSAPDRKDHIPTTQARSKLAPHICVLIVLVINLAFYSKAAPTLRLIELTVCREYYQLHDPSKIGSGGFVNEGDCKLPDIQKKVAWLSTADELLHFCCDFIATIPLGILADHVGPKPVMLLNFGGLILSWFWVLFVCTFYTVFRSESILLASLFCILGGSTHFNTAIIYSEAALYTSNWTTAFSFLEGTIQVAQLLGPVIGSSLLFIGIYPPFYFALPLSLLSIPLALLLPTGSRNSHYLKVKRLDDGNSPARSEETQGLLITHDELETPEDVHQPPLEPIITRHRSLKSVLATGKDEVKRFWRLFMAYRIVQYGYAASLIVTLGKQALHILLQYVSKRFNVSIAEAGFLFTIKACVVLFLYVLILPSLRKAMPGSKSRTTIRFARISILFLAIGVCLIGLAWNIGVLVPGLITYALGFGFPILVRSLISSVASAQGLPIPVLFSGMAIAETAGSFIGAMVLTTLFTQTLEFDGWLAGTPFLVCSAFYCIILIPTWFANLHVNDEQVMLQPDRSHIVVSDRD